MAHHAGDKVTLVLPDGSKREFEILSVIKENYYALTNRYSIMFCYYTTADIFKEMESEDFLMSYLMNVEDQKEKSYGQFVENYTTTTEPLMDYESKQKYIDEFAGMKNLFILVGGTLSIVIGLIGILNFINSVLTNVVTRRKEFAMMEAIGMTKKQLLRMADSGRTLLCGNYNTGSACLWKFVFLYSSPCFVGRHMVYEISVCHLANAGGVSVLNSFRYRGAVSCICSAEKEQSCGGNTEK